MARNEKGAYVYVIKDGDVPIYVGKGTGNRMAVSARRFGGTAAVLEHCKSEVEAFERERHWIAELRPVENVCAGRNGNWRKPRPVQRDDAFAREIKRLGSQVCVARLLCMKLDESNIADFGISKLDLSRLREVAHG